MSSDHADFDLSHGMYINLRLESVEQTCTNLLETFDHQEQWINATVIPSIGDLDSRLKDENRAGVTAAKVANDKLESYAAEISELQKTIIETQGAVDAKMSKFDETIFGMKMEYLNAVNVQKEVLRKHSEKTTDETVKFREVTEEQISDLRKDMALVKRQCLLVEDVACDEACTSGKGDEDPMEPSGGGERNKTLPTKLAEMTVNQVLKDLEDTTIFRSFTQKLSNLEVDLRELVWE